MSHRTFLRSITGRPRDEKAIAFNVILTTAARHGIKHAEITSQTHRHAVVLARDEVCFQLRDMGLPFTAIGKHVNRDHTTVIAAVSRHSRRMGEGA